MKANPPLSEAPVVLEQKDDGRHAVITPAQLREELFEPRDEKLASKGAIKPDQSGGEIESNAATASLARLASKAVADEDWERAKAALERALKIAPSAASIWRQLAYCYYQTGDYAQAFAQVQRALSLSAFDEGGSVLNQELIGLINSQVEKIDSESVRD